MRMKEPDITPVPAQKVVVHDQQRFSKRCGIFSFCCLLFIPVFMTLMFVVSALVNPGITIGYSTQSGDQFDAFWWFLTIVLIVIAIGSGFAAVISGIAGNRQNKSRVNLGIILGAIPLVLFALIIIAVITG